jgi:PTS system ascorbate-specific IIC component
MSVINFLITQVMSDAGVLFGLITLVGLLFLRRPVEEVIMGTVKAVIGFLILLAGVGLLQEATNPISAWVAKLLGVKGILPQGLMAMGIMMSSKYGGEVALAILLGFILNLILARVTPLKSVGITGHLLANWAAWVVAILTALHMSPTAVVIIASILSGLHYWLATAITHYFMKRNERLTSEWALYLPDSIGVAVASWIGKIAGNPEKRCADIKVSKRMEWLRDSIVGMAVLAAILWTVLGLAVGREAVEAVSNGKNWVLFSIFSGFKFAGGLAVLIYGVRMLLGELVPAFNGIAKTLIPGAIAGLDYPTVFQFAPQAVFIGFIFNLLGGIAATLVMIALKFPVVVIPSVWTNFWMGALTGVFADAYGGRRGTIIATFIIGFLVPFGWSLGYPLTGPLSSSGLISDYTDVSIGSIILYLLRKVFFVH